jgi:hypothetical protein
VAGCAGGQVYGATDKIAAYVKNNPVSREDLLATIYYALGVLADGEIFDREGRRYAACEGRPVTALFG